MFTSDQLEQLIDAARRDVIATVDQFLDRSRTLDDFKSKWEPAKALYDEMNGSSASEHIARRVGREAAQELRDALCELNDNLAMLEEWKP